MYRYRLEGVKDLQCLIRICLSRCIRSAHTCTKTKQYNRSSMDTVPLPSFMWCKSSGFRQTLVFYVYAKLVYKELCIKNIQTETYSDLDIGYLIL